VCRQDGLYLTIDSVSGPNALLAFKQHFQRLLQRLYSYPTHPYLDRLARLGCQLTSSVISKSFITPSAGIARARYCTRMPFLSGRRRHMYVKMAHHQHNERSTNFAAHLIPNPRPPSCLPCHHPQNLGNPTKHPRGPLGWTSRWMSLSSFQQTTPPDKAAYGYSIYVHSYTRTLSLLIASVLPKIAPCGLASLAPS
jgi:hypothetical protein